MSQPTPPPIPPALEAYPDDVRDAYVRFVTTADDAALQTIILAAVREHLPRGSATADTGAPLTDDQRLIDDLGFDSLAIAETVFLFEDVFHVKIANAEIARVRTVGELREFVRAKLGERT